MTTHKEFMASLPKKRRAAIQARAAEILAEEMTLQELRKALDRSQETTAEALGSSRPPCPVWNTATTCEFPLSVNTCRLGGELEFYARFKEQGAKARLVRIRQKNNDKRQTV
jgi:hypothetical protein